jgi:C4-dicarboxylate-specific signal transduction histidine kinase
VQESLERAADDARDFDFEHRLLLPSGAVKQVKVVARPMASTDGANLIGAVMDVTAIRAAEAALRSARTELAHVMRVTSLGELTASIAHEVNQPLGAVVANAEACIGWLDRDVPDLAEARAAIARIVSDGLRAGEVIRRVRALVKRSEAEATRLNINDVVLEAVAFLRHELDRSRVSVRLELGADPILVLGDRIQLQQVLINLGVITDVRMPVIGGIQLQTMLRAQGRTVPFIFVTAFPETGVRAQAMNGGAVCFLEKPFHGPTLLQCVEWALHR